MSIEHDSWNGAFDEEYSALGVEDALTDEDGDAVVPEPPARDGDEPGGAQDAPANPETAATQAPDEERLADLLDRMATRRKVLLGILGMCREPVASTDLERAVDDLQAHNQSVFSSATLLSLLEQAGGLRHVNEDGSDFDAPREAESGAEEPAGQPSGEPEEGAAPPAEDNEDDFEIEYLEVEAAGTSYWVATPAGVAAVEADDPRSRLAQLLEEDAFYLPVYREILETLADGPVTKAQVDVIVKGNPLTQDARHQAGYFIDRLERADAIAWTGPWSLTDVGRAALDDEALYR